ncbi:transcriptional regulator [Cellulomonas denverensis]|uniref:LCP family protein n=1 Tax=Cellulomonas denverensis TaxID=264297 RepID=A0A7X6KUJ0_9CELL|nr:LCP family protein [Cellulomonas denverensis]GIG25976.1 transcriptional regulator [Cellulomonas denverensis]
MLIRVTNRHALPARPRAVRHGRFRRSHHVLRGVALTAVGLMAFGISGAAALYQQFNGNIASSDVGDLVTTLPQPTKTDDSPADPNAGQPVNLLLLGSDERDGENEAIGGFADGMRSDTSIVAHISADRTRVELISIPRDSLVDIPSCTMSDGSTTRAQSNAMFNSAFSIGADNGGDIASAAACTWNTVQTNTGVPINHFVVVDFAGFTNMIDAIGGVEMCIPNDMSAPKAGLYLSAGNQRLDGTQALAFARARTGVGVGDGSDTNRLGRQQELLAAVMRELLTKNLLTDVTQLIRFLDQATASLSVDSGFSSISDMAALAYSLRGISSDNISFMTIPFAAAPSDPNRVVWTSDADTIWDNIANDRPMTTGLEADDATADTGDTTGDAGTTDPAAPADTPTADPSTPAPQQTREAGKETFTANDVTAVCG